MAFPCAFTFAFALLLCAWLLQAPTLTAALPWRSATTAPAVPLFNDFDADPVNFPASPKMFIEQLVALPKAVVFEVRYSETQQQLVSYNLSYQLVAEDERERPIAAASKSLPHTFDLQNLLEQAHYNICVRASFTPGEFSLYTTQIEKVRNCTVLSTAADEPEGANVALIVSLAVLAYVAAMLLVGVVAFKLRNRFCKDRCRCGWLDDAVAACSHSARAKWTAFRDYLIRLGRGAEAGAVRVQSRSVADVTSTYIAVSQKEEANKPSVDNNHAKPAEALKKALESEANAADRFGRREIEQLDSGENVPRLDEGTAVSNRGSAASSQCDSAADFKSPRGNGASVKSPRENGASPRLAVQNATPPKETLTLSTSPNASRQSPTTADLKTFPLRRTAPTDAERTDAKRECPQHGSIILTLNPETMLIGEKRRRRKDRGELVLGAERPNEHERFVRDFYEKLHAHQQGDSARPHSHTPERSLAPAPVQARARKPVTPNEAPRNSSLAKAAYQKQRMSVPVLPHDVAQTHDEQPLADDAAVHVSLRQIASRRKANDTLKRDEQPQTASRENKQRKMRLPLDSLDNDHTDDEVWILRASKV